MVYWNDEWEVYEFVHDDGFIEIFRDDLEAMKFADDHGLEFRN